MFCTNCGRELPEGVRYCPNCGAGITIDAQINDAFDNMANDAQSVFEEAESSLRNEVLDFHDMIHRTPPVYLKTDRNLLVYILLSFITCGIYGWYFIYRLAQDINIACDGDGDLTPGLVPFVLLSMITCGIYAWFWYYRMGNRLAANAPRYGMVFQEDGTTVLLWCIFGIFVCGIGPYVGLYILIKNANLICDAYNRTHGLYHA